MMKSIYLLLVVVALVQGAPGKFQHVSVSEEEYRDDCTEISEDSECSNNPGIYGTCKQRCSEVTEMVASAPNLCPGNCVCCTKTTNKCERTFAKGFCSAGGCEDGLLELMYSSLCPKGFVCCKQPATGSGTNRMTEAGERGLGPHFHSFDGLKFKYGGKCIYTLVKEKSDNPSFAVNSHHMPSSDLENVLGAFHSSVEIKRNEHILTLHEGMEKIYLDGQEIQADLPYEATDHSILIDWTENQKSVNVGIPGVLNLEFNGKGKTTIDLHPSQHGKVWGLLGNANGNTADDLTYQMSDGKTNTIQLSNPNAFVKEDLQHFFNGWLVTCATR